MGQSRSVPSVVIAIDPGRDKCGLAAVAREGRVLHRAVVPTAQAGDEVSRLLERHPGAALVMGDRTAAKELAAVLGRRLQLNVSLVDEHHSTLEGRRRYFRDNPPRGWRRLLPIGLQTPPRPYDDYVAVIIAERYLLSLPRG